MHRLAANQPEPAVGGTDADRDIGRRGVLKLGAAAATMLAVPTAFAGAATAQVGPLQPANSIGLRLPAGYSSRIVARTGQTVGDTNFVWHAEPDGGACFGGSGGGWVYVSNSEVRSPSNLGGVGLIHFNRFGDIIGAREILSGTTANCAGGATPWNTWLSCEEHSQGQVYETYPMSRTPAVVRPALGRFQHEAVAVDPIRKLLFLTEDQSDGCLYAFRPSTWPNLAFGSLFVMVRNPNGSLGWRAIDPNATNQPTRYQAPAAIHFQGGEGIVYAEKSVYFATKGDNRIWRYRHGPQRRLTVMYDDNTAVGPPSSIATGVDNLTANDAGSIFVAEDGGDMQIVVVKRGGITSPLVQIVGTANSEVTGVAFNPTGNRMYFSSQRNPGITYEVTGPFQQL